MRSKFFFPAVPGQFPDGAGYFGAFGGKFIPEALVAAVDELALEYERAKTDPAFAAELEQLLAHYAGRPSVLTEVPGFGERAGGARVFLKREDLNHTGSHKINNVLGQALLTRRMGKPRVIAETGAGQHGVATATACALFGLECTIYMGDTDIRRQAVNVARMKMLGATVIPVTSGSATLKDAINETFRDWVANVETTHYIFGTVAGPHPFPAMIRDFQRVIGVEARQQILERAGRLPDAAIACVGGGSNAIGLFHAFLADTGVRLVGCEAAGHGVESGKHAATLSAGEPGILHGSRSYVLQDDEGQITEPWSISAGLDYPGVGPEHAYLRDTGRGEYRPVTDAAAMQAFRLLASSEGIIPAIESAHALAGAIEIGTELGPDGLLLVGLSGRGDKDMDTAARYFDQDANAATAGRVSK
jgi:tryptophan synthase beta chain